MATDRVSTAIAHLRHAALARDCAGLTDGQLLERYLGRRDPTAFAALVLRHGPMVLGVCRRIVGDVHDAEDAFQATFLVLVRKASSVRPRAAVGNWLYGVACRTALKAKTTRARRRSKERQVATMPRRAAGPGPSWSDVAPVLDEELQQLPDKYRLPVVLCDLEGRTRREVARQLGLPDGTLSNHLATGRRLLAARLARRGITLPTIAVGWLLTEGAASAALPAGLAAATIRAAAATVAGPVAVGIVSANVSTLTEGVVRAMTLGKLKTVAVVFTATTLLSVATLGPASGTAAGPQDKAGQPRAAQAPPAVQPEQRKTDKQDQLLREEFLKAAVEHYAKSMKEAEQQIAKLRDEAAVLLMEKETLTSRLNEQMRAAVTPAVPVGPAQVRIVGPAGMKVWLSSGDGRFPQTPTVEAPGRVTLVAGQVHRLKLANIPNRPGLVLYPTVAIARGDARSNDFLTHTAIPIEFTAEDYDNALKGDGVVTRIVYLTDPKNGEPAAIESAASYNYTSKSILDLAKNSGSILATVRLGNIDLGQAPPKQ